MQVLFLVRVTGIEPACPCEHKNLNLARLPVPPHPLIFCCPIIIPQKIGFVKGYLKKSSKIRLRTGKDRAEGWFSYYFSQKI